MRNIILRDAVLGVLGLLAGGILLTGCRGAVGAECLTDSDCEEGLICSKGELVVNAKTYLEKYGKCVEDDDMDGIPADGDFDGSPVNFRCGVQFGVDRDTGFETVFTKVFEGCDDNCPAVANSALRRRFACFARDACCTGLTADERKTYRDYELCEEVTPEQDTCQACITGAEPMPTYCYTDFTLGPNMKADGCLECRELQVPLACTITVEDGQEVDSCKAAVSSSCNPASGTCLPQAACSGAWTCSRGFCRFTPKLALDPNQDGVNVYFQLDSDGDGTGDTCDNCRAVANGIECQNPSYVTHCDVDGDGTVTPLEISMGDQANKDGDGFGDACDLCPDLASRDNEDTDGDGCGNACDPDSDGDRICDPGKTAGMCNGFNKDCQGSDNCPFSPNPDQRNMDGDEFGDACDVDADGDGVREDGDGSGVRGDNPCRSGNNRGCDDNCPAVPNESQADANGDGVGDACD